MENYAKQKFTDALPAARTLSPADYTRLLHPEDAIGKPTIMVFDDEGKPSSKICDLATVPFTAEVCLDTTAYLTLNRFHGRRGGERLAALNALYLDLDTARLPNDLSIDPAIWSVLFTSYAESLGLPQPSTLTFTGRGLAAVWLIKPLPPTAHKRWQPALKAMIDLFRNFGADPSCSDASRVFRLPGTINRKSGKEVQVLDGSMQRYNFDVLADAIYRASDRPVRAELKQRKARKTRAQKQPPAGLSPRARFAAIQRDLDRLCAAWGGTVPSGRRNSWLHIYATALTHTAAISELEKQVIHVAALATPGLTSSEVKAIAKFATKQVDAAQSRAVMADGRYHYAGARIAEILDVTDALAQQLCLEQVISTEERKRRKATAERKRRRLRGAISRKDWLSKNNKCHVKPWEEMEISKATFYRRGYHLNPTVPSNP